MLVRAHVIKKLLFCKFSLIPTFDFDLILWSFFTFGGPNGLLFGICVGLENFLFLFDFKISARMIVSICFICFRKQIRVQLSRMEKRSLVRRVNALEGIFQLVDKEIFGI